MWVSSTVLEWGYHNEHGSGPSLDDQNPTVWRAHEIWRHANSLISENCSSFALSDAIANLKRAINHRLQSLSKAYCFNALPFSSDKKTLEKFQHYGIIRPSMLRELFEVRNAIEHRDADPPSLVRCEQYVDFVWYFLKSTDSLLLMQADDVVFWSGSETGCALRFCVNLAAQWEIVVHGDLPEELILSGPRPGALEIDESYPRPEYIKSGLHGKWNPTDGQLTHFARCYFATTGFWYEDHA